MVSPNTHEPRELEPTAPDAALLRTLLRKLRDRDLRVAKLELGGGRWVSVEGCSSVDAPVEGGVRYRLRDGDGTERVIWFEQDAGALRVGVTGGGGARAEGVRIELELTPEGQVCARELGARMRPERADAREADYFVRRLVRGVLRGEAA